eukprot:Opistho-1_new@5357
MRSFFVLAVTAALIAIAVAAPTLPRVAYDNHKVIRIIPSTVEQARAIRGLGRFSALGLDFWQEPSFVGQPIDVRVPPQSLAAFEGYLREINAEFSTIINDVQELIEATMPGPLQADADFFSTYHTLDDINAWLKQQVAQYPNLASLVNVGTTHEGRTLTAIKITGKGTGPKPGFWFDGGIHAREWISTGVNVYLIGTLLSKYGTDANITRIVDAIEFTILPVFNADGYVYTFATDRMWRKTRSPNAGSSCVGVDPNRNWDEHWGEAGASTDPCAEDYQGPSAFSEIEVKSVAQYIKAQGNIKRYINFHSYSQLWMSPWGYTSDKPKDYAIQNQLSQAATNAIKAVHGTAFQFGPISTTIYPASGSSADWTYAEVGAKFSYGVELRDTGKSGFLLPANQIVPSGEEILPAILIMADYIINDA